MLGTENIRIIQEQRKNSLSVFRVNSCVKLTVEESVAGERICFLSNGERRLKTTNFVQEK